MQVMIRRYKMLPDGFNEIAQAINEGFLPTVQKIKGYQDYYFFQAGEDNLVTVGIFEDAQGADESVRSAAQFVRERNLARFLPNPPEVMTGKDMARTHARAGMKDVMKEGGEKDTTSRMRSES